MTEAIDPFEQKCYDTAKAKVNQFLGEYHSSAVNMMFQTILHYDRQLKELRANAEARKVKKCATCEDFHVHKHRVGGEIIESQFGWCEKHGITTTKSSGCKDL